MGESLFRKGDGDGWPQCLHVHVALSTSFSAIITSLLLIFSLILLFKVSVTPLLAEHRTSSRSSWHYGEQLTANATAEVGAVRLNSRQSLAEEHSAVKIVKDLGKHVHIASTMCGTAWELMEVMLKSMSLNLKTDGASYHVHIQTDHVARTNFDRRLKHMSLVRNAPRLFLHFYTADTTQQRNNLYRPCAGARLTLPQVLLHVDCVVYVDADVIWDHLDPSELHEHCSHLSASQSLGVAREVDVRVQGFSAWYLNYTAGKVVRSFGWSGVNSGVLVWNLTRSRMWNETEQLNDIAQHPPYLLKLGDQDVINTYLHDNPHRGLFLPCHFNLRKDNVCPSAERSRPALLHDSAFRKVTQRTSRCTYGRSYPMLWSAYQSIGDEKLPELISSAEWPFCKSIYNVSIIPLEPF